ncbi:MULTISPECIES: phage head closure protein [unclassified Enterococcus]|uniref:phage head closure protein n=1 Tax=unclassified Enterococcus TaxID=2608891 RepID=UPI003F294625
MDKTWDLDIVLLKNDGFTSDEVGNQVPKYKSNTVMACKENVSRGEFYQAGQNGIENIHLFIIHPYEYYGENYLKFDGNKYKIIRTYQRNYEELEIVCRLTLGDANV